MANWRADKESWITLISFQAIQLVRFYEQAEKSFPVFSRPVRQFPATKPGHPVVQIRGLNDGLHHSSCLCTSVSFQWNQKHTEVNTQPGIAPARSWDVTKMHSGHYLVSLRGSPFQSLKNKQKQTTTTSDGTWDWVFTDPKFYTKIGIQHLQKLYGFTGF